MARHKILDMPFAEFYPYLLAKLEKKGHTTPDLLFPVGLSCFGNA